MNLSLTSKKYIEKYMLDYIDDKDVCWNKRDNNTTFIYKSLYKDIQEAFLHVLELSDTDCMKGLLYKDKEIKNPKSFSSYYMSAEIKKYIEMYGKHQITFTCSILDRQVTISFMIFSNSELKRLETYQKYAEYMYTWLYICIKYSSKKCANNLHIFMYHTPYHKTIPKTKTEIIGTEHINSAYTTSCVQNGEVVIFRKEEWFKVFVHETMHIYGLDFSSYQYTELIDKVKKIFPIKSEFSITDAYCETWARIINCAFTSFLSLKKTDNISNFLMYMDVLIQMEKFFSIKQAVYVLQFMGLTYQDLYSTDDILRNTMYREKSHVFPYYIITAMFMNDFQGFLSWCKYNNTKQSNTKQTRSNIKNKHNKSYFIQFNYSEENIEDFGNYIQNIYKSNEFLNGIATIQKYKREQKDDTLRMSIVEFK